MLEISALLVMVETGTKEELTSDTLERTDCTTELAGADEVVGAAAAELETKVSVGLAAEVDVGVETAALLVTVTVAAMTVVLTVVVAFATATVFVTVPAVVTMVSGAVYMELKQRQAEETEVAARLKAYSLASPAKSSRLRSASWWRSSTEVGSSSAERSSSPRLRTPTVTVVVPLLVTVLYEVRVAETVTVGVVRIVMVGVLIVTCAADAQKGAAYAGRTSMKTARRLVRH